MSIQMLSKKSLTELRGIAQSFEVADLFQKDRSQLIQAIELKQQGMSKPAPIELPRPEYDARLMTKAPSNLTNRAEIEEVLAPLVARGLHVRFDEERWYFSHAKKTDEGTLRMPLRVVLRCAEQVLS